MSALDKNADGEVLKVRIYISERFIFSKLSSCEAAQKTRHLEINREISMQRPVTKINIAWKNN